MSDNKSTGSYANEVSSPGEGSSQTSKDAFNTAKETEQGKTEARASEMVKNDQPKPVLKPLPQLSMGVDKQAFNKQWSNEQKNAEKAQVEKPKVSEQERAEILKQYKEDRHLHERQEPSKDKENGR